MPTQLINTAWCKPQTNDNLLPHLCAVNEVSGTPRNAANFLMTRQKSDQRLLNKVERSSYLSLDSLICLAQISLLPVHPSSLHLWCTQEKGSMPRGRQAISGHWKERCAEPDRKGRGGDVNEISNALGRPSATHCRAHAWSGEVGGCWVTAGWWEYFAAKENWSICRGSLDVSPLMGRHDRCSRANSK